jgi:uncharacterized protein YwqG
VKRATIEFDEVTQPIREVVTKFGGQPTWLGEPQWPLSRESGEPMRFICQIRLDEVLFGAMGMDARMAYLFMTDGEEYIDGTWEPEGGENAVVLQPGGSPVEASKLPTGPTLYRMVNKPLQERLVPEACEYAVRLSYGEDPPQVGEDVLGTWNESEMREHERQLEGNKLGGTPLFLQAPEFPGPGEWRLLLQLDSTKVPFYLNFGDSGVGYAFLSVDSREARFLWQGC